MNSLLFFLIGFPVIVALWAMVAMLLYMAWQVFVNGKDF
jgi:hypothetical protein